MKNFWLIMGGISVGIGLSELRNSLEKGKTPQEVKSHQSKSAIQIIAGSAIIFGGIKGFD